MSLGQVGLTAESFFGGLGVVGGHLLEVRKVKKRRLSVRRRAVTASLRSHRVFEECYGIHVKEMIGYGLYSRIFKIY